MKKTFWILIAFCFMCMSNIWSFAYADIHIPFSDFTKSGFHSDGSPQNIGASVRDIRYTFTTELNQLVVLEQVSNQCEPNFDFPTATKDTIDLVSAPNIAAGKTATCYSCEEENPASHAVDGDYLTRWSRGGAEEGTNMTWLQVDLGNLYMVNRILLLYESSNETVTIKYSTDGSLWYTYKTEKMQW